MTDYDHAQLDEHGFLREATGLTTQELFLLIAALNGLLPRGIMAPETLATEVAAASREAFIDYEEFGADLNISPLPERNPAHAEHGYIYQEMAEKIAKLAPVQAALLQGFVFGVWTGIEREQRQRKRGDAT